MNKVKVIPFFILFLFVVSSINAQDNDLLKKLEKELPNIPSYTQATFKSNRITFGQSIETRKKGTLEFNVIAKFWNIPNSQTQDFGADRTTVHFGVEYAFSDRFTGGFGVGTFDGILNGYGKYRLIRQKDSDKKAPIAITLFQSISHQTRSFNGIARQEDFADRFSFTSQVIIARKFNPNFSFQLVPSYIRRNSDQFVGEPNDHFALGFGARYKISNHVSIASEYYYVANPIDGPRDFFGPFGLGVNWDVRNVILKFSLTNTRNFAEAANIANTFNNFNFNNGNLHISVGATYAIHLKKKEL